MIVSVLETLGYLAFKAVPMTAADSMSEYLQRLQSLMISFHESMSQIFKGNSSESALDMRKNLPDGVLSRSPQRPTIVVRNPKYKGGKTRTVMHDQDVSMFSLHEE